MHLFISAGEPSGDLHGANLIRALQARDPNVRITGFGGDRMEAAGATLLFPLTRLAVMWVGRVLANLGTFFRLAKQAENHFKTERPDAVILIDYPGFHFALAKRAHAAGVPVYFFVPPQLWAWRGWRVKKVHRWFAGVFTALPFEDKWYRDRGVKTHYVGHPYYDELAAQRLDDASLAAERAKPGLVIGLLPGSRDQEVTKNVPPMLAAARRIHASRPDVRFLVAAFNEHQAALARKAAEGCTLPIEFHVGRTPEIIELAHSCVAVSGSVSLELMYRLKPTVIVYKAGWLLSALATFVFMMVRYVTLVNLLANEEVFPEYPSMYDRSRQVADNILTWLNAPAAREQCVARLRRLKDELGRPGACDRAAAFLADTIAGQGTTRTAA